jgi:hypothetical protein
VNKLLRISIVAGCLLSARSVEAIPLLQLDILNGHFDPVTETIIADGSTFTLVALLTPKPQQDAAPLLADTYYISAAINPSVPEPGASLGSFTWEGTAYDVTGDMTYGTPPIESSGLAPTDPGDLSPHGIFPTYFAEFSFQFSETNRTERYNVQEEPGGLTPTSATNNVAYYALFNITTSLSGTDVLHFDLYDSYIKTCSNTNSCVLDDTEIEHFAPFSHDAQSSSSVPEPQSLLLFGTGLVLATRIMRRKAT